MRRRLVEIMVALHFAIASSTAPAWASVIERRPVAVLPVGEPTPALTSAGSLARHPD